ncbi:hypothetical protein KPL70_017274 [Citrus sinensis]|nr:hypothetical protein KPL70_017274 [Citrus sinensis]
MFERRYDGTVRMTFRPPTKALEEPLRLSFTYSAMVTVVQVAQEKLPITGFNSEGYPVYPAKLNGHFLWDSLGSGNCDPDCPCWDDWEEDDDEPHQRRKPKMKIPKTPCSHNKPKPPHNPPPPPAPLPIYQKELKWIAKTCKTEVLPHIQNSKLPIQPMACMMSLRRPPNLLRLFSTGKPKMLELKMKPWLISIRRTATTSLYSAQIIPDPSNTNQTSYSNRAVSEDPSEFETESPLESSISSSDSKNSYADITRILMAQPEETEPAQSSRTDPFFEIPSDIEEDPPEASSAPTRPAHPQNDHKPSHGPWFTFDDIPASKWRDRLSEMAAWTDLLQEFAAWIDLQGTKPNAQSRAVLREFMARFTGSLRDWLESLGDYRQLQFMPSPVGTALNIIHEQFIGEKTASTDVDRKEYHQMKCCYLKRHLLKSHYKRMSILFYKLNGFNEPSLKHVFITSLPSELQPDLQRKLTATNLSIADISLGKIFQMAMLCLDKICEQKEFFKDIMQTQNPSLKLVKNLISRWSAKMERKRKSITIVSFARNAVTLLETFLISLPKFFVLYCTLQHSSMLSENKDVESNFSEQSTQDDQTAFIIAESSNSEDISVISTVQNVNHVSTIPRPSLKMSILPSKFHKLVPVIGFIDTGAYTTMIDPSVLPSDY